jgi:hypothetical protein
MGEFRLPREICASSPNGEVRPGGEFLLKSSRARPWVHSSTPALQHSSTPTLQYSNTPVLQYSSTPSS